MRANLLKVCLLVSLFTSPAWARGKSSCISKELRLKSCRLSFQEAEYNLSRTGLRIHDGTWRGVVQLPFVDETTDWHSVKIREKQDTRILEMKAWRRAASAPDLELENLHWMIFELSGTNLNLLADKVVRLRRRQMVSEGQEPHKFLNGKLDAHLILVEDGKLLWKVGHKKGPLFPEEQ